MLNLSNQKSYQNESNDVHLNGETRVNISLNPSFTKGFCLFLNQILAMFLKRILSTARSWILLLTHIFLPVLFLITFFVTSKNLERTQLPAMPLDLNRFDNPVTLVENLGEMKYSKIYKNFLSDFHHDTEVVDNIIQKMISLTKTTPVTVRQHYITGASFNTTTVDTKGSTLPLITAWFNNDPYHSPGITLSLVLNTMFRGMSNCSTCTIEFTNHPMPFTADTQINQLLTGQNMGSKLASTICFIMTFVAPLYVIFIVKENISKSKHLQFVSGVKVYIFWAISLLWDMITYLVIVVALVITLVYFQEDGFKTADDIGRIVFILFNFGWAFLPMFYLFGYLFDLPSSGYTNMISISIFAGPGSHFVINFLSNPAFQIEYIVDYLHLVFLLIPHYSLANGISENFKQYSNYKICTTCINGICFNQTEMYNRVCKGVDDNYYKWEAPGIGRNIYIFVMEGAIFCICLLVIEYRIFPQIIYYLKHKLFPQHPDEVENQDSDVLEEKQKIRNASYEDIANNYTLVLRDLTKFYKNHLVVNSLCLGVQKYECFGLLGVNGAGKTTTFKMMTGDVEISYGDGWVNGYSIKYGLKKVYKVIGYCPQFDALLDDLTARETIKIFSLIRGIRLNDCYLAVEHLARKFDFLKHLDKKVKDLSGGNKRKLSTAISIIGDPLVIYLDEPTTGMDPATKRYIWNALCELRDNGTCIILTSHSMEECEALCTRLAIMVNGVFMCLGSTQHLKNKFSEGYTVTIKLKKHLELGTEATEEFMYQKFPGAVLREKHQELLYFYITDKSIPISKMFGNLEEGKRRGLNIEDYSIGQSSLEQVFLTFTRRQAVAEI